MKLAVIVTDFPSARDTFLQREMMMFREAGVDLRIYHLTPRRGDAELLPSAAPLADHARRIRPAGGAARWAMLRHAGTAASLAATILRRQGRDRPLAARSLGLIPAALAIGDELRAWGADHIHAEAADHAATAAWIAHQVSGVPYSISCRAQDIFRSQALLAQKFADAAAVRTVSDFGRRFLASRVAGAGRAAMRVIHAGVDVQALPAAPKPRTPEFRILFAGPLRARQGVAVLLQALALFHRPGWRLDIAGDGPLRADLQALAHSLGIGPRVHFLDAPDHDALAALIAAADVCVAPAVIGPVNGTEGIPETLIEALARRRPAISTAVSGIPELIRPGLTGWLVAPGDANELTDALEEVYDSPAEADRRALAGRRLVERAFDLRQNALQQLRLFGWTGRAPVAQGAPTPHRKPIPLADMRPAAVSA